MYIQARSAPLSNDDRWTRRDNDLATYLELNTVEEARAHYLKGQSVFGFELTSFLPYYLIYKSMQPLYQMFQDHIEAVCKGEFSEMNTHVGQAIRDAEFTLNSLALHRGSNTPYYVMASELFRIERHYEKGELRNDIQNGKRKIAFSENISNH